LNYIGYVQLEELLRHYLQLKALLKNLQFELEKLWQDGKNDTLSEDDILYSLSIGNRVLNDMPHATPSPGEKLTGIIQAKDRIIEKEVIKEYILVINTIGEVIEKTTAALKSLPTEKQTIVTAFYFEGMTWGQISIEMHLERDALKERRKESLDKMLKVLRITRENYDFCMGKVM